MLVERRVNRVERRVNQQKRDARRAEIHRRKRCDDTQV